MTHAPSARLMDQALPAGYNPNASLVRDPGPAAVMQASQLQAQRTGVRGQESAFQAAQAADELRQFVSNQKGLAGLPDRAEEIANLVSRLTPERARDLGL